MLVLGLISFYSYWYDRKTSLYELDQRLSMGAACVKLVLQENFQDRATNADAISFEEDSRNIDGLSKFARKAGFEFLYTLVKIDTTIYITSSSATQDEVDAGTVVRYFTSFDEANPTFWEAFDSGQAVAFTHEDRWGIFRAYILPEKSVGDLTYLSVAEYEISEIERTLRKNILKTLSFFFLLLLACVPLFYLFMRREKRNIAQLKESETKLKRSIERFITVMNSIPAAIYVADLKTYEILFMNRYLIENLGKDFTGEPCWRSIKKESKTCKTCRNQTLLEESKDAKNIHVWHEQNKHTNKWYTNYDRAIEWIDGRPVKLQISIDITDSKELEAKLRESQKMESIGDLAAGIAHDFNNLLFPILGMAELLLMDLPEESPEAEMMKEIFSAGKRGSGLVQQILAFSRQSEHKMEPVRVQSLLIEVLKLSRATIPSNIEITQNIQPDCGLVMADATSIHQIAMNLITNAYHAIGEQHHETIDVQLKEISHDQIDQDLLSETWPIKGQYLKLSISDTGCGIDPTIIDKIFDPYFTTKPQGKGTGLGLSVVYGIVKEHDGELSVKSEPGRGSTFNIFLPILKQSTSNKVTSSPEIDNTGSGHILVVDDEESIAKLETQILERLGYTVTYRLSSTEALELFKERPNAYDLVISDMSMPKMTGERLAKKIKNIRPSIPIIICTGFIDQINKDQDKAELEGVDGFLKKPILVSEMAQMVKKFILMKKVSSSSK